MKTSFWKILKALGFLLLFPFLLYAADQKPKPQAAPGPTPVPPTPPNCELITVPTPNADNLQMPVVVRWPTSYQSGERKKVYRVLLLIPYFPETAQAAVARCTPYTKLADKRDWFIVSPGFAGKLESKNDRNTSYYFPQAWSGKAVLDALDIIKKKYPIDTNNLLMTGLSGGAKFNARFAQWASDRVTAVVVHSSTAYDEPGDKAKDVAWIITVGEADQILPLNQDFIAKLNAKGALPVFRTFLGMLHEDYPDANNIATSYLEYYDEVTKDRVGKDPKTLPPFTVSDPAKMPFVGDYQDYIYYANTKENVDAIPPERRIYLPTREFARQWGTLDRDE